LVVEYGRGFTYTALTRMAGFFVAFPEEAIVATLLQQLSWSHFRELLPLKQPLQREYYAQMCRIERWSVRTLHQRINDEFLKESGLTAGRCTENPTIHMAMATNGSPSPELSTDDGRADFLVELPVHLKLRNTEKAHDKAHDAANEDLAATEVGVLRFVAVHSKCHREIARGSQAMTHRATASRIRLGGWLTLNALELKVDRFKLLKKGRRTS